MKRYFPFLAICLALAGCSHNSEQAVSNTDAPNVANGSPAPPVSDAPATSPGTSPKANAPKTDLTPEKVAKIKDAHEKLDKKLLQIPPDWPKTGKVTPEQLAAKISQSIQGLRSTGADVQVVVETPEGRGDMMHYFKIEDPTHFDIQFLVQSEVPTTGSIVADGKRKATKLGTKWVGPMPIAQPLPAASISGPDMAHVWARDFSRLIFQGVTDRKDAWIPTIAAWSKGVDGYKVWVEETTFDHKGYQVPEYRLRAKRTDEAAAKLGASEVDMVIDGYHFLPVTIRAQDTDKDGKKWKTTWSAHYYFNYKFKPGTFRSPFSS